MLARMLASVAGNFVARGQWQSQSGTGSFVVPDGVTSISVVGVGGGQGGYQGGYQFGGGAGASLAYANNIPVTPGETLSLQVGSQSGGGTSVQPSAGGDTWLKRGDTVLMLAPGGGSATAGVGDAVNAGGAGLGGGGGAGGYSGVGGDGGWTGDNPGKQGAGGAGGGGAYSQAYAKGAGGGGVGIGGQGASGAATTQTLQGGRVGSYSMTGNVYPHSAPSVPSDTTKAGGVGGRFGGGGGKARPEGRGGNGGEGAIRIIWPGDRRQFPSTRTGDE